MIRARTATIAVTAGGSASVPHRPMASAITARTRCPSAVRPAGVGTASRASAAAVGHDRARAAVAAGRPLIRARSGASPAAGPDRGLWAEALPPVDLEAGHAGFDGARRAAAAHHLERPGILKGDRALRAR